MRMRFIDAGKRDDVGGGGAGRLKVFNSGGGTNSAFDAGCDTSERAWDEEGTRGLLLFGDGVRVGGGKEQKCTGQRVRVVLTSFINSVSLPRSRCRQK